MYNVYQQTIKTVIGGKSEWMAIEERLELEVVVSCEVQLEWES